MSTSLLPVLFAAFRAPLLQGFIEVWTVAIPLDKANVGVAQGGGVDVCPFEAAWLCEQGNVDRVLEAAPPLNRSGANGGSNHNTTTRSKRALF